MHITTDKVCLMGHRWETDIRGDDHGFEFEVRGVRPSPGGIASTIIDVMAVYILKAII